MTIEDQFKAWWATLPHCIGYAGGCDGELVGTDHEPNCPVKSHERSMDVTYIDAFKAGFILGRKEES